MHKKLISMLIIFVLVAGIFTITPQTNIYAAANGKGYYRISTSDTVLNIRSGATTESTKLGSISKGVVVNVTEVKGNWGRVSYAGIDGWICLDYATKTDAPQQPTGDIYQKLNQLRVKFPDGKYWNHYGSAKANPDGYTDTPCPNGHYLDGVQMCNGQCDGYARKIGQELFGTSTYSSSWVKKSTLEGLCVGDLIRYSGKHTIVVLGKRDDNTLVITDCNWDYHCGIRWDADFSISRYIKSSFYVLHEVSNNNVINVGWTEPTKVVTNPKLSDVKVAFSDDYDDITVECSANDVTGLSKVVATIETPNGKKATVTAEIRNGKAYADFDLTQISLAAGVYKVTLVAYSVSGGTTTATATCTVSDNVTGQTTTTTTTTTQSTTQPTTGPTSAIIPVPDKTVKRLGSTDRVSTAALIADYGWSAEGAVNVVLANGFSYADALAGVPLAKELDAPILLTGNGSRLESNIVNELQNLNALNVYILGGSGVVDYSIEGDLRSLGYKVTRLNGSNRFETAAVIAGKLMQLRGKAPSELFFVYGHNYPDALAVSTVAAIKGCPILYAPANGDIDGATAKLLKDCSGAAATVVGGTSVIKDKVLSSIVKSGAKSIRRLAGKDRFDTAAIVCESYKSVFKKGGMALATGYAYPDALAGGAFAAAQGYPLVLTGNGAPSERISGFIAGQDVEEVYVLGGENAVSNRTVELFTK